MSETTWMEWAMHQRLAMTYDDFLILYQDADRWGLSELQKEALYKCLKDEDRIDL